VWVGQKRRAAGRSSNTAPHVVGEIRGACIEWEGDSHRQLAPTRMHIHWSRTRPGQPKRGGIAKCLDKGADHGPPTVYFSPTRYSSRRTEWKIRFISRHCLCHDPSMRSRFKSRTLAAPPKSRRQLLCCSRRRDPSGRSLNEHRQCPAIKEGKQTPPMRQ